MNGTSARRRGGNKTSKPNIGITVEDVETSYNLVRCDKKSDNNTEYTELESKYIARVARKIIRNAKTEINLYPKDEDGRKKLYQIFRKAEKQSKTEQQLINEECAKAIKEEQIRNPGSTKYAHLRDLYNPPKETEYQPKESYSYSFATLVEELMSGPDLRNYLYNIFASPSSASEEKSVDQPAVSSLWDQFVKWLGFNTKDSLGSVNKLFAQ
ncbi:MAG: hypothetical protein AAF195_01190 [Pseudomonadota bacterium]